MLSAVNFCVFGMAWEYPELRVTRDAPSNRGGELGFMVCGFPTQQSPTARLSIRSTTSRMVISAHMKDVGHTTAVYV